MATQKPRLGIFGVGRMGRVHVEHLVNLALADEVDLVTLGDRKAVTLSATCSAVARQSGPELAAELITFECPETMAAEAALDAVVIASRTEDHVRDSLPFVRRDIPVMVEKPLASSIADAARLVGALGDRGNRLIQVALQRYYDSAAMLAMDWMEQGLIGQLQQSHHVLQDKNPTPSAYQSSGITADMAIHLIFEAMSFHAFELPQSVQALRFMAPHYEDGAGEGANVVHVFCSWRNGSLAHLWGSRINQTGYDNGFKLIGTAGRIDVGEFAGDFGNVTAKLWRGTSDVGPVARGTLAEQHEFPMTRPSEEHPDFYPRFATAYARELDAFLSHVRHGTPFEIGPEVGWKTLLVANVAEASSRRDGHRFELHRDGKPIGTIEDAARFAAELSFE